MSGIFPRTFLSFSAVLHKTATSRNSPPLVLDWLNSSDITNMDETGRLNEYIKAKHPVGMSFFCFSRSFKVFYSL